MEYHDFISRGKRGVTLATVIVTGEGRRRRRERGVTSHTRK